MWSSGTTTICSTPPCTCGAFFDAAGDYIFLIDEAHNLPDRARAMYSARFCKSSLTDARRAIGKGKSALKTALTKADKGFWKHGGR